MRYLLDTQTFFWMTRRGGSTPVTVKEAVRVADEVLVSDASAFEVALKVWLGKFDEARRLVDEWSEALAGLSASSLAVQTAHALRAGSLSWDHRDPFDRLIAGQAIEERLTLITADRAMLEAPGVDVLPW